VHRNSRSRRFSAGEAGAVGGGRATVVGAVGRLAAVIPAALALVVGVALALLAGRGVLGLVRALLVAPRRSPLLPPLPLAL
jgi:hypothetical protein